VQTSDENCLHNHNGVESEFNAIRAVAYLQWVPFNMKNILFSVSVLLSGFVFAEQAIETHNVSELKILAQIPVGGDWMGLGFDSVWLATGGTLYRSSVKTNSVAATIPVGGGPYRGIVVGDHEIWVPSCGNQTLYKISPETNTVVASIQLPFQGSEASVAYGADSVWIVTNGKFQDQTLSRIDAKSMKVVAEIALPYPGNGVTFQAGKVWITSSTTNHLMVVDAKSNTNLKSLTTGSAPRFVTSGEDFVWLLNQRDGTVQKFNANTGQLVATIDAGLSGGGGDIFFGEGAIWATMPGKPVVKIDKDKNKVLKIYQGSGLGDAIRAGYGSVWVSGGAIHRIEKP